MLCGVLMVGIAYQTNDKFSIILLVEGVIVINYAIMSRANKKSINFM